MNDRDLPAATIAGRRDWQTVVRGLAIATAFGVCAAMFAANLIGGLVVVGLIGGLWLHRRHVVAIDDRAPRRSAPRTPPPSKEVMRLRWITACAIFGIVIAVQVPWASLLDETTIATTLIVVTMAMAFRR